MNTTRVLFPSVLFAAAVLALTACGSSGTPSATKTPAPVCRTLNPGQVINVYDLWANMQSEGPNNEVGAVLTMRSPVTRQIQITLNVQDVHPGTVPDLYDVAWGETFVAAGIDNVMHIPAAPYGHEEQTRITSIQLCARPLPAAPAQTTPIPTITSPPTSATPSNH